MRCHDHYDAWRSLLFLFFYSKRVAIIDLRLPIQPRNLKFFGLFFNVVRDHFSARLQQDHGCSAFKSEGRYQICS